MSFLFVIISFWFPEFYFWFLYSRENFLNPQAQPIDPDLTAKLLGRGVAVSPVVTVEPRRRKFHKAITLSIPTPRAHSQGMINQYSGNAPTLRLLCSITGMFEFGDVKSLSFRLNFVNWRRSKSSFRETSKFEFHFDVRLESFEVFRLFLFSGSFWALDVLFKCENQKWHRIGKIGFDFYTFSNFISKRLFEIFALSFSKFTKWL